MRVARLISVDDPFDERIAYGFLRGWGVESKQLPADRR
jgi:hypothetical protein